MAEVFPGFALAPPPDREIEAMAAICRALDSLGGDRDAIARVLRWADDRYGAEVVYVRSEDSRA